MAVLQKPASRGAQHVPQPAAQGVPQALRGHSLVQSLPEEGLEVPKQDGCTNHQLPGGVTLPDGAAEAQQPEHTLLHVVGQRLPEGLDQHRAHRALRAHAPQQLPKRLPPAPPVLAPPLCCLLKSLHHQAARVGLDVLHVCLQDAVGVAQQQQGLEAGGVGVAQPLTQ